MKSGIFIFSVFVYEMSNQKSPRNLSWPQSPQLSLFSGGPVREPGLRGNALFISLGFPSQRGRWLFGGRRLPCNCPPVPCSHPVRTCSRLRGWAHGQETHFKDVAPWRETGAGEAAAVRGDRTAISSSGWKNPSLPFWESFGPAKGGLVSKQNNKGVLALKPYSRKQRKYYPAACGF